jgi:hypothetical protein
MKAIFTSLLAITIAMAYAQEQNQSVSSKIRQATVFLEGAQVTRNATVNLRAGVTILTFKNLSPRILEQSIQAEASQGVKILSVAFNVDYLEKQQKPGRISNLEIEKKRLAILLRQELSQEEVYKEEEIILKTNKSIGGTSKGVEVEQLKIAMDYFRQRLLEIKSKLFEIDKNIRKINEDIAKIDSQLRELSSSKEEESGEIAVKVSSKADVQSNFSLKYLVKNAKWFPSYDIRAKNIESPVSITYKANVSQQSGEDWDNVELTISSANPLMAGEKPSLKTWVLGFNNGYSNSIRIRGIASVGVNSSSSYVQGRVISAEDRAGLPGVNVVVKGTTIGTVTDAGGNYHLSLPPEAFSLVVSFIGMKTEEIPINGRNAIDVHLSSDATQLTEIVVTGYGVSQKRELTGSISTVTNDDGFRTYTPRVPKTIAATTIVKQTNFEFTITEPFSIKSDGEVRATDMVEYGLDALYEYSCVPKIDLDAFLIAKVTGWDEYNFLAGEANLFFEGKFIGKSVLDTRHSSDTLRISLGRDSNVSVKREKLKNLSSRQLIGSSQKSSFTYQITVRNKKTQPVLILIEDQLPIPNTKDIDVDKIEDSNAEHNEETGLLKWKKVIQPGKTEAIKLQYTIRYPKSSNMILE